MCMQAQHIIYMYIYMHTCIQTQDNDIHTHTQEDNGELRALVDRLMAEAAQAGTQAQPNAAP